MTRYANIAIVAYDSMYRNFAKKTANISVKNLTSFITHYDDTSKTTKII